jgi:hypothetical protein
MKSNKLFIGAIISAGLILPLPTLAGPITTASNVQTFSFSVLNETTSFSFAGFNNNLGTLNSVHLNWIVNKTR